MAEVVKSHRHEIDRLAESRRVRIVAVGCWVGEHWRVFLLVVAVGGAALSRWVDRFFEWILA